jgi:hypothetical protein
MKPFTAEISDSEALEQLGRASVQVIHDLKNQMNGLKLYATFLKKRLEKADRPVDEQETVVKLISGLERAATDMSLLSRFGKPVELKRQKGLNLVKVVERLSEFEGLRIHIPANCTVLSVEADPTVLREALKTITLGALGLRTKDSSGQPSITLSTDFSASPAIAILEWDGINENDLSDPFNSFAGSEGIRMSFAARIIAEHGGVASREADRLFVRLPLMNTTVGSSSVIIDHLS